MESLSQCQQLYGSRDQALTQITLADTTRREEDSACSWRLPGRFPVATPLPRIGASPALQPSSAQLPSCGPASTPRVYTSRSQLYPKHAFAVDGSTPHSAGRPRTAGLGLPRLAAVLRLGVMSTLSCRLIPSVDARTKLP